MTAKRIAIAVLTTATLAGACSGMSAAQSSGGPTASARSGASATPAAPAGASIKLTTIRLVVPKGEGGAPFTTTRRLQVPKGWTARVWARVPDARMEAWSPQGDLLVSEPANDKIVELVPDRSGTATVHNLLTGLSGPQGLAFARYSGHWVLYVGEGDQIDRYPWGTKGIYGTRTVVIANLPDADPAGDDVHEAKDVAVTANGTIYFDVGSSSNANPDDLTMKPPRATIESVRPNGTDLRIVERGVRNGEGLAVAPNGTVWTAVNERDNIPYPFHRPYDGIADPFGMVIQAYVNNHPPDEVVPVTQGRNLGWPYCNPDQDENHPAGSLLNVPLVADALTNPGGVNMNCAQIEPINIGLPAHSAPLGMAFLEGSKIGAPWTGGAVIAIHGSWNKVPPRSPAVLWLAWNSATQELEPAITLITGFQLANGTRWGRPVDAVPGPDGALYITDDTAGAVYRLVPPK